MKYENVIINNLDKLLGERLSKRGNVQEEDRFNYTVKMTVTWFDQVVIENVRTKFLVFYLT